MKFYHYTSLQNLYGIASHNTKQAGLMPARRFIETNYVSDRLPEKATDGAIFGLLEPFPEAWCKQEMFVDDKPALESIVSDLHLFDSPSNRRTYLLEVTLDPSDDVYVADYGVHLRVKHQTTVTDDDIRRVKRAYWDSLIPIADYQKGDRSYHLPEVVSFLPIPLARIEVVDTYKAKDLVDEIRRRGGFSPKRHATRRFTPEIENFPFEEFPACRASPTLILG